MGGGGGWWINPLQTLSQGLVLTLRFTFGPELDKNLQKIGPILVFETLQSEISLFKLHEQI